MFSKDGVSKKFAPEHNLFCNIWKDCISFFQKMWFFFFRRKMKEDDLYQKTHGDTVFSVYMRRRYRCDIAPTAKKKRCPEKIHLRVTFPASLKKMIFILDSSQIHPISAEMPHSWTPQKGPKKQPPEIFYKKRCSQKFRKIHNERPVPEPLF